MTTLEIITRCYKRSRMLADNIASLSHQTDSDFRQTLLHDDLGIGVPAANAMLASVTPAGRYVWVLDDDDLCIHDGLVEDVRRIEAECNPDLIMVRFDHGWLGILPTNEYWKRPPQCGRIGGSGVIARADLWMAHCDQWATGRYVADCDFVTTAYRNASNIYWHDVVVGRVQRISYGAPE